MYGELGTLKAFENVEQQCHKYYKKNGNYLCRLNCLRHKYPESGLLNTRPTMSTFKVFWCSLSL